MLNRLGTAAQPLRCSPSLAACVTARLWVALVLLPLGCCGRLSAQEASTRSAVDIPSGFSKISGEHIDVITDLPLDDSIRELPAVFDAAMLGWCQVFELPPASVQSWRAEAFLMRDRQRFIDAGLLPKKISHFTNGFQLGDKLWVMEQPSSYYRRHLLLHEGTHWIMSRKNGGLGPPWLAEGMAEWLGTHRWDGQHLQMGIVPASSDEVPYWGRTILIEQQLSQGTAPSLETVLRYSNSAHQQQEAYVWSWAAVMFLKNHPETAAVFDRLLQQPWQGSDDANRWLFAQLRSAWPRIRQQWQVTLGDLDYGFDPQRGLLSLSRKPVQLRTPRTVVVDSTQGWQATGIAVNAGAKVTIAARGEFSVGSEPKPWTSTAAGVHLEYYHGNPLGQLLMATAATLTHEPDFAQPLSIVQVGEGGEFTLQNPGELLFRINESIGGLADNSGSLKVTIQPSGL